MSLAPAVSRDGFAYAGDLFAEASGHNRHRRATVAELKDHFKSGSEKDHPAHWFEAQLIHYGLQPSKTKAVARMRLFDAVNGGKLAVPAHIKKLESELKKDWTKNERDAKKALKGTEPSTIKSAKRKAESEHVDLTVSVGDINITLSASNSSKRARTTASKPATPSKTSKAQKKTPDPKPLKKVAAPKATPSTTARPKPKPKAASEPRVKAEPLTAPYSSFGSTAAAATPTRRAPQTGRQGPPPSFKIEDSDDDDYSGGRSSRYGNVSSSNVSGTDLKPLGLLNGRYSVSSAFVDEQWGSTYPIRKSLVLTLQGDELWGKFDLGVVAGILHFERRPYQSSEAPVGFMWRGREEYGPIMYGSRNDGWVRFLGDGSIEGFLGNMCIPFEGRRKPNQGTRSEVDARDMAAEWDGYNEDVYERERRGRWGGGSIRG